MYRVILASYDTWLGGKPWDDSRFEENADRLGIKIQEDPSVQKNTGCYVILPRDTIFYHATTPDKLESILSEGLKCQSRDGKQTNGVYLTGGKDDLKTWRGKDTVVLQVIVPAGTKVYEDFQPNAVYITQDIPFRDIELVE